MEKNLLSPKEVCVYVEQVGVNKVSKKALQTLFLGILAGIFIALGGFAAGIASHAIENYSVAKLVSGIVFPVGLILVLVCGAELFTGNTLLSVALFKKKISFKALMKNWSIVYLGNLIGSIVIVYLLYFCGSINTNHGLFGAYAVKVAVAKVNLTFVQALLSGILANILVCLAVWGSYVAKDTVGKIFMAVFPILAFIISGFEHSIANMYYLSLGLLVKDNETFVELSHVSTDMLSKLNINGVIQNLIPVTIGNIIGGALVIGGIYWFIYKQE